MASLLALILAIQPSVSYGAGKKKELPRHVPAFEGQAFEGVDHFARPSEADNKAWSEYLKSELQNREKTNIEKVKESGDDLVQLMISYKNFYAKSMRKINSMLNNVGYEKTFYEMDHGRLAYEDLELGRMEFTNIDGEPVAKIVHEKSGVAFIIYDEDLVERDSKHFHKYIARQHYDPGSNKVRKYLDENGKKKRIWYGRDTLIMGIKGDLVAENNIEVKPRKRSIKHWWKATYAHPDKKTAVLGVLSGLAQFVSVGAIAQAVAWMLPGYEPGSAPAMIASFTLAYGTLFGVWNSTYQNWRSRGPKLIRDAKNMSVSVGYYFGVYLLSQGFLQQVTVTDMSLDPSQIAAFAQNTLASASEIDLASVTDTVKAGIEKIKDMRPLAMVAATHFFHNFWANNEFKNIGYWLQQIEELEYRDKHNVTVPVPVMKFNEKGQKVLGTKRVETPMPRRFWNRQFIYYLPVNWAKFLDQVWFAWTIGPAMSGQYPEWLPLLSIFGFWGGIHASYRTINWWAYKNHKEAAEKLHIREESKYYFMLDNILKKQYGKVKSACSKLFQ